MPRYVLPVPRVARPLAPVDPYRHRDAYVALLSALYHAEAAALEGFGLLGDARYVQAHDLFDKACKRLMMDEQKHLDDLARLVGLLTDRGVDAPTPSAERFWRAWREGTLFALPFKPAVASLFCLFSEGLGYAVLYHLADVTTDAEIREALWENVVDEQMHLRLSISVLRRALERDPDGFLADFAVYGFGYALLAKDAIRDNREIIDELGIDFNALFGSSIRFVADLLMVVAEESGHATRVFRAFRTFAHALADTQAATAAAHAAMYLPEPPYARSFVLLWGRLGLAVAAFRQSAPKALETPPTVTGVFPALRSASASAPTARADDSRSTAPPPRESMMVLLDDAGEDPSEVDGDVEAA